MKGRTRGGKVDQPVDSATVRLEAKFLAKKPKLLTSRCDQITEVGFGGDRGRRFRGGIGSSRLAQGIGSRIRGGWMVRDGTFIGRNADADILPIDGRGRGRRSLLSAPPAPDFRLWAEGAKAVPDRPVAGTWS